MDFSIKAHDAKTALNAIKSGCIVVGVFENRKLSGAAKSLDQKGAIAAALKAGDISDKAGSSLLLRSVDGVAAERVLLVGLGKEDAFAGKDFSSAAQTIGKVFASMDAQDALVALPFDQIKERYLGWAVRAADRAARYSM
jgi:leucyl aminopeptidase